MKRIRKTIGFLLAALVIFINYTPAVQFINKLPNEINLYQGDFDKFELNVPEIYEIEKDAVQFEGNSLQDVEPELCKNDNKYTFEKDAEFNSSGSINLSMNLLGIIPVKKISVNVTEEKCLYAGGQSLGIALVTQGVLVVSISKVIDENGVVYYPCSEAKIKPGDIITGINNEKIKGSSHLSEIINDNRNNKMNVEISRKGEIIHVELKAEKSSDGSYRIGAWVRDSALGVGTLTYIDPSNMTFAALGHPINDIDTGELLPVETGKILPAEIFEIIKGEEGVPGELRGIFYQEDKEIGEIKANTEYGIYGTINSSGEDYASELLPVARADEVETGKAEILCTLDDNGIKRYEIEILKLYRQDVQGSRSMVIEVTDPILLEKTGGIVQGMSGSPIIQNGKIIGAVTHVFVNNPKKGYGLLIDWMIEESDGIN